MSKVVIIDFGSQFTQLIARRVREYNVYCEIFPANVDIDLLKTAEAFILSGGPGSVDLSNPVPQVVEEIFRLNKENNVPILGICYGMQLICRYFNIDVHREHTKEFGKVKLKVVGDSPIIKNLWSAGDEVNVWMSHFDSIRNAPESFNVIASSVISNNIAIIANDSRRIYATQFHPEVTHTPDGVKLLFNFLNISNCKNDWTIKSFLEEQEKNIKELVGNKKVIAAVSGGVDSSVAATLMHKFIGKQLCCIFIDTGLLRKDESKKVQELFTDKFCVNTKFIDRSDLFLKRLQGIVDPEEKRKIIGKTFIEVFEEEAQKLGDVEFLMQGTLYPDIIESGLSTHTIKSHHNVGGLPEVMKLNLVEPLKYLFKDEVRLLGRELGLSDEIVMRHPFPGPGLAVRIIGEVTEERIRILQEIDDIYINTMKSYNLYSKIWQAFAVLLPIKSVGVMGDGRTYDNVCALRAVTSFDGMTADAFPFEDKEKNAYIFWDFLQNISNIIINNVKGVNRVVYDITSKPPATIEWE